MGFWDFREKYWWKNFMHKLYSWGASIVLVGALFKITHWPGATEMLTVGLLTEAFIFFMSGLEPPHEEYDWTLVFPELAGITDEDELASSSSGRDRIMKHGNDLSVEALAKFEEMLEKAGEGGLFEKLHDSLQKLNQNVSSLNDISQVGGITERFAENMSEVAQKAKEFGNTLSDSEKKVSYATEELADVEKKSAEVISYAAENLADKYNVIAQDLEKNKNLLNNAYQQLANSMQVDFSILSDGNKEYNEQISLLNKNLQAINAIFEMQLEDADLEDMVKNISDSAKYADKYNQEIQKLAKNLSAMNDVYGRMLSALNVKLD